MTTHLRRTLVVADLEIAPASTGIPIVSKKRGPTKLWHTGGASSGSAGRPGTRIPAAIDSSPPSGVSMAMLTDCTPGNAPNRT